MDREQSVQHFLDLLKKSRRGNFKIYIGMIAGVGKSYRMLSDAHQLLESGIDVKVLKKFPRQDEHPPYEGSKLPV